MLTGITLKEPKLVFLTKYLTTGSFYKNSSVTENTLIPYIAPYNSQEVDRSMFSRSSYLEINKRKRK